MRSIYVYAISEGQGMSSWCRTCKLREIVYIVLGAFMLFIIVKRDRLISIFYESDSCRLSYVLKGYDPIIFYCYLNGAKVIKYVYWRIV